MEENKSVNKSVLALATCLLLFTATAFAQVSPVVPDGDPLLQLVTLIQNGKTMGPLALGMGIVVLFIQGLKKFAVNFKYLRLANAVLATAYSVLFFLFNGQDFVGALLNGLFLAPAVGAGGMAVYEAVKGLKQMKTSPA